MTQIINVLHNMVDCMYIGHLPGMGASVLTDVGVTFPIIMAISVFAALVSMGGAPRASIMLSKGKRDEAENILGNYNPGPHPNVCVTHGRPGRRPLYHAVHREHFKCMLISCIAFSSLMWAVSMFAPQVFVYIFTKDTALTQYASWAMGSYIAMSLLFGAQLAYQQTFIAPGDSKTSLFPALLRKVFLPIPLIYVLPVFFSNKVIAVFIAVPMADAAAVCTTVILFVFFFRKPKREIDGEAVY